MPQVPRAIPTQQLGPDAAVAYQAPEARNLLAAQAGEFGRAAQQFGADISIAANRMLQEANMLRAEEAENATIEAAMALQNEATRLKGSSAITLPSGNNLIDEYSARLQEVIKKTAAGLGNEAQRNLYAMRSGNVANSLRSQLLAHQTREYESWQGSVNAGTVETARRAIAAGGDFDAIDGQMQRIDAAALRQAALTGKQGEAGIASLEARGKAVKDAVTMALLDENTFKANKWLDRYGHLLSPVEAADYRDKIQILEARAAGASDAAADYADSTKHGLLYAAIERNETGRVHWKGDDAWRGGAGEVGIMQIKPDTAKEVAEKSGLGWDPELFNRKRTGNPQRDAEAIAYNRLLGRRYYDEQLAKYMDPVLAAAAYNAGPGAVDKALAKAAESGGDWRDHIPASTRDYINRFLGHTKNRTVSTDLPRPKDQRAYVDAYGDTARPIAAAGKAAAAEAKAAKEADQDAALSQALSYQLANNGRPYDPEWLKGLDAETASKAEDLRGKMKDAAIPLASTPGLVPTLKVLANTDAPMFYEELKKNMALLTEAERKEMGDLAAEVSSYQIAAKAAEKPGPRVTASGFTSEAQRKAYDDSYKRNEEIYRKQALDAAMEHVFKTGGGEAPYKLVENLRAEDFPKYQKYLREFAANQYRTMSDPVVYQKLLNMMGDEPAKFAGENLVPLYPYLSTEHREWFQNKQAEAKGVGITMTGGERNDMARNFLNASEILTGDKERDLKLSGQFNLWVEQEAKRFAATKKAEPSPDDMVRIMNEATLPVRCRTGASYTYRFQQGVIDNKDCMLGIPDKLKDEYRAYHSARYDAERLRLDKEGRLGAFRQVDFDLETADQFMREKMRTGWAR